MVGFIISLVTALEISWGKCVFFFLGGTNLKTPHDDEMLSYAVACGGQLGNRFGELDDLGENHGVRRFPFSPLDPSPLVIHFSK